MLKIEQLNTASNNFARTENSGNSLCSPYKPEHNLGGTSAFKKTTVYLIQRRGSFASLHPACNSSCPFKQPLQPLFDRIARPRPPCGGERFWCTGASSLQWGSSPQWGATFVYMLVPQRNAHVTRKNVYVPQKQKTIYIYAFIIYMYIYQVYIRCPSCM